MGDVFLAERVILLGNHKSYEDFSVVKVILIPPELPFSWLELVKKYLIRENKKCYEIVYKNDNNARSFSYYYFIADNELDANEFLFRKENMPTLIPPEEIPDDAINTESIFDDESFYSYLRSFGIAVIDPEISI